MTVVDLKELGISISLKRETESMMVREHWSYGSFSYGCMIVVGRAFFDFGFNNQRQFTERIVEFIGELHERVVSENSGSSDNDEYF